ncbi:MAG TPA: porphobilinogen synthase [Candidatus Krumholzibacteria bacterium]|nr:porphobilinogen synthase [Candidatus Krumholzibacteria bacterium]
MINDTLTSRITSARALPRRERRLRATPALRRMVRETSVTVDDFVYPLFVTHGRGVRKAIGSMPGVFQLSVDEAVLEAERTAKLGVPSVLLFGIPAAKDPVGEENFAHDGVVQQATRAIKQAVPELIVVTDVCMCEYTDHGHCGILNTGGEHRLHPSAPEGFLLNDETLEILDRVALSHAEAGADIVAPSGMIDGMVGSIRDALDAADFTNVAIMSYSVKYASSFYGPFRDAAEGAPRFGDRKTHQMDPGNAREAVREAERDIEEGADFLMVKPALAYLDVIRMLRDRFEAYPIAAYNVSGEYSMIKAAAANGWMDEQRAVMETLTAIKRAGADVIISYHAKDVAEWLR